jgi:tetratricopeptide (TPR) repeat protein
VTVINSWKAKQVMTKRPLFSRQRFAALLIAALASVSVALAQAPPSAPSQPTQPAAPTGRAPIRPKTQAEYQAYQTAIANAQNADAMEKAADDFAGKFPDSDLRVLLYRAAMHSYQTAGNSSKMLEMGLKVLGIDRDDPEALIGVAQVQEEHTSLTDLDRDQRMTQAITDAQHALETIDTDLAVPAGSPPDRVEAYKKYLRATALSIVGSIQYKRQQYPDAEITLRKALDADPSNPDAVVVLRLALALDQEKKYPEALEQANRAVQLTQENTDVGRMARNEHDRLVGQTGAGGSAASNAPATGNAPAGSAPAGATPPSGAAPPQNPQQNSAQPSH